MSIIKPRTAAGTMELLPRAQIAFERMLKIISDTYERYGFLPIETPVFEPVEILLTKSGGETEKQVYFVEKTGTVQKRLAPGYQESGKYPDEALRFDLTVPLARYVAEHEHELTFPFRRYQRQRVYRGERPQRGRLNEFYQCDIDVIGKDTLSPAYDAELPAIICSIFDQLAFGDFTINFSNRKVLLGLLEAHQVPAAQQVLALREIDKLDKIGADKVRENITAPTIGLDNKLADTLLTLAALKGTNSDVLAAIAKLPQNEQLAQGYRELNIVCEGLAALGVPEHRARLNPGIVRGLDYYTGTVYETSVAAHPDWGSICSGGRYENLAGHYTKSHLPGVGLSIGATRLFDQLRATEWAGAMADTTTEVLITMLDDNLFTDYLQLATQLRNAGIATEIMLEGGKIQKQMKYADRAGIHHVVLMGSEEKTKGTVTLKNLTTGEQKEIAIGQLAAHFTTRKS